MNGLDALLGMLVVLGAPLAVFVMLIRRLAGDEPVGPTVLHRYPDPQPLSIGAVHDASGRWDLDAAPTRWLREPAARRGRTSTRTLHGTSAEAGPRP